MFYYPDLDKAIQYAGESSRTTHGAQECVDACKLYACMLIAALAGKAKSEILFGDTNIQMNLSPKIQAIAEGEYRTKTEDQIRGSGYVVESLEAALWCFNTTEAYSDAILKATNLGDDADTTAAICGQIAGAYYGESGIPSEWLNKLTMRDKITEFADKLAEATKN